jgi:hypothetical protein
MTLLRPYTIIALGSFCSLSVAACSGSSSGPNGGSGGNTGTGGQTGSGGSTGTGGNVGSGGASDGSGGMAAIDAGSGDGSGSDARDSAADDVAGGDVGALARFSFFATSLDAMRRLSKSQDGFGGDLRYGEMTGLAGADKICTEIAESSMPGSSAKQWRAFLSVARGPDGGPVHAIDRVGEGPWYDRLGRLVSMTKADLITNSRPNAHPAIKEDLPNELGIPNHRPDPSLPPVDNHHFLTGSNAAGRLVSAKETCLDWTSSSRDNKVTGLPQTGFSWSAGPALTNWIYGFREGGCGVGVGIGPENLGPDPQNPFVGSGGGYGGIYCLALKP